MTPRAAALLLGAALLAPAARAPAGPAPSGPAAPLAAFRQEFDAVCARTQDAMTLPDEELRALVARCEALKPLLEKLGESERKVYGRRLQACRDLYQFVLDSRAAAPAPQAAPSGTPAR